jgi:hypothetical protein
MIWNKECCVWISSCQAWVTESLGEGSVYQMWVRGLNRTTTLKGEGLWLTQCCKYYHFLSDFSPNFKSFMKKFHYTIIRMQNISHCGNPNPNPFSPLLNPNPHHSHMEGHTKSCVIPTKSPPRLQVILRTLYALHTLPKIVGGLDGP